MDPIKSNLLGREGRERDKRQGGVEFKVGAPLVSREKCGFSKRSMQECIFQLTDTFLPTITDPHFQSEELKDPTQELHILDKLGKG